MNVRTSRRHSALSYCFKSGTRFEMSNPGAGRMSTAELTTIHVGHSPDSDDAFMFYALTHNKLDTGGLKFIHQLEDIETLNKRALKGELEVSAVSIHAYAYLAERYALLGSGSSRGDQYGPTIVPREPMTLGDLEGKTIA